MKFLWKGNATHPEIEVLTVKVGGNPPIELRRGVPYQFQNDGHYRPYRARFEVLTRGGTLQLLGRDYTKAEKPAPAPERASDGLYGAPPEAQVGGGARGEEDDQAVDPEIQDAQLAAGEDNETAGPQAEDAGFPSKTVAQLREILKGRGVETRKDARKADLLELLGKG